MSQESIAMPLIKRGVGCCGGSCAHSSDCAVHHSPAFPSEGCDCGAIKADESSSHLRDRITELESAITDTLRENLHLADGWNCTLKRLKDVLKFEHPDDE